MANAVIRRGLSFIFIDSRSRSRPFWASAKRIDPQRQMKTVEEEFHDV